MTPLLAVAGIPVLPILVLLACVVLFVTGFVAPERSKRLQRWMHRPVSKAEAKAVEKGPDDPDKQEKMDKPFHKAHSAIDKSAQAGRNLRGKIE